jgi:Uma2 family endonuclease
MNVALKRMTVEEFLEWAETQSEGNFELVDGQIVTMVQERALHNLAKIAVWQSLRDAPRDRGEGPLHGLHRWYDGADRHAHRSWS